MKDCEIKKAMQDSFAGAINEGRIMGLNEAIKLVETMRTLRTSQDQDLILSKVIDSMKAYLEFNKLGEQ